METFLTARSQRFLAVFEISTPGLVVTALAWTVGVTFIPISSRFSIGMIGLLLTSSINQNRRMKSSFVKCLEHIDEFPGQLPFSPLLFHEIDLLLSAFPCFIIIEQYSVQNYILLHIWEGSTFPYHIPFWHIPSSAQRMQWQISKCSVAEIPGRRHKLVSSQPLNCSFFYSIWRKTAYFGRFCVLIKRNMEYDLFPRKAS